MVLEIDEIITALHLIASQDHLDVCVSESLKGATIAGAGAFVGGVLMGPPGIAVGATLGGLAGSALCKNFKPLPQVLMEMSERDRQRLYVHMTTVLNQLEVTDFVLLMAIASNPAHALRGEVVQRGITAFFGGQGAIRNNNLQ